MAVFRIQKTGNYTVMSNHHFKNRNLSLKAKGLLSLMLSLPDDWNYTLEGLTTLNADGRDSIRTALQELEKEGYLVLGRVRDESGRLGVATYDIYEQPQTDLPITENPTLEKPISDKPTQLNTNKSNTNKLKTKTTYIPTLVEIKEYIKEKNLNVDAQFFYDYFTEGDWIDSNGNPVRNWKQKLITWSKKNNSQPFVKSVTKTSKFEPRDTDNYYPL